MEKSDKPILLRALGWIGLLISWSCAAITAPLYLYLCAFQDVVASETFGVMWYGDDASDTEFSRFGYVMAAPFRWLLVSIVIPFFVAYTWAGWYVGFYLIDGPGANDISGIYQAQNGNGLRWFLGILFALFALFIVLWGFRTWKKRVPRLELRLERWSYGWLEGQADCIAFICFLISVPFVVRWPFYPLLFTNPRELVLYDKEFNHSARISMMLHPLFAIVDLLTMPLYVIVRCTWRHWTLDAEAMQDQPVGQEITWHQYAWDLFLRFWWFSQFCQLLYDIFVACMACILILFPWRLFGKLPHEIRERYNNRSVYSQSSYLRMPYGWIDKLPVCVWNQLGWAFIDFLAFIASIIVFATMYRVPALYRECVRRRGGPGLVLAHVVTTDWYRQSVWDQAVGVFTDFPFFIMGLIVTATLVRAVSMYEKLWDTQHPHQRRAVVLKSFGWMWVDFLDLPFFIIGAVVALTGFRGPQLFADVRASKTRGQARLVTACTFCRWLLDWPCLVFAIITFATGWRARSLYRRLKLVVASPINLDLEFERGLIVSRQIATARVRAVDSLKQMEIYDRMVPVAPAQAIILQEFAFLLVDIPFVAIFILMWVTIIRGYLTIRLLREASNDWDRRRIIASQFWKFILDIPAIICGACVFISWRAPSLYRKLRSADPERSLHLIIFIEFLELVLDLPFVALGIATLWRLPQLIWYLYRLGGFESPKQLPRGHTLNRYGEVVQGEYDEDDPDAPIAYGLTPTITPDGDAVLTQLGFDLDDISSDNRVNDWARRLVAAAIFVKTLCDPPVLAFGLLMLCTGWRVPMIYGRISLRNKARAVNHQREVESVRRAKLIDEKQATRQDFIDRPLPEVIHTPDLDASVHRIIASEFIEWLLDLPFLLFLLTMVGMGFWRLPRIVMDYNREKERLPPYYRSRYIRERIFIHWCLSFCDILCIAFSLPLLVTWRAPTYIAHLRRRYEDDRGCDHTRSIIWQDMVAYRACWLGWKFLFADLVMLIVVLLITLSGFELPRMVQRCIRVTHGINQLETTWRHWKLRVAAEKREADDAARAAYIGVAGFPPEDEKTQDEEEKQPEIAARFIVGNSNSNNAAENKSSEKKERTAEEKKAFGERLVLQSHARTAANEARKHYINRPAIGVASDPEGLVYGGIEMWLRLEEANDERTHRVDTFQDAPHRGVTIEGCLFEHGYPRSFTLYYLAILTTFPRVFTHAFPNFVRLPTKFIGRILGLFTVLYIYICVFFLPLCKKPPKDKFKSKDATKVCSALGLVHVWQMLTAPGLLPLLGLECFIPFFIITRARSDCSGDECSSMFWSSGLGDLFRAFPWWGWLIFGLWQVLVMGQQLWWVYVYTREHIWPFHPFKAVKWFIYRILTKQIWRGYKGIFVFGINYCYKRRRSCCYVGEWLIILIFVVWVFWPVSVPLLHALRMDEHVNWWGLGFMISVSAFLAWTARWLLQLHWAENKLTPGVIQLDTLLVHFPGYGVRVTLRGRKPREFGFSSATLNLEGEPFWEALYASNKFVVRQGMKVFRSTSLPILVTPSYLNPADFKKGEETFETVCELATDGVGVAKKLTPYLINKRLNRLVERGNPSVNFVLRYTQTKKEDGIAGKGTLFCATTTPKDVVAAAKNGLNLLTGDHIQGAPIVDEEKKGEQKSDEEKKRQPLTEWWVYDRAVLGYTYASRHAPTVASSTGWIGVGTRVYSDQILGRHWVHLVHPETRLAIGWYMTQDERTVFIVPYESWTCDRCNGDGHTTTNEPNAVTCSWCGNGRVLPPSDGTLSDNDAPAAPPRSPTGGGTGYNNTSGSSSSSNGGSRSNISSETKTVRWVCGSCDRSNLPDSPICSSCRAARNKWRCICGRYIGTHSHLGKEITKCTFCNRNKRSNPPMESNEKVPSVVPAAKKTTPVVVGNKWICSQCSTPNNNALYTCTICQTSKYKPVVQKPPPGFENVWLCANCSTYNDPSVTSCHACRMSKPHNVAIVTRRVTTGPWRCTTCFHNNEAHRAICRECGDARRLQATPVAATSSSSSSDVPSPPVDEEPRDWACGFCTLENTATARTCAACSNPRPTQAVSNARRILNAEAKSPRRDQPAVEEDEVIPGPPPVDDDEAAAAAILAAQSASSSTAATSDHKEESEGERLAKAMALATTASSSSSASASNTNDTPPIVSLSSHRPTTTTAAAAEPLIITTPRTVTPPPSQPTATTAAPSFSLASFAAQASLNDDNTSTSSGATVVAPSLASFAAAAIAVVDHGDDPPPRSSSSTPDHVTVVAAPLTPTPTATDTDAIVTVPAATNQPHQEESSSTQVPPPEPSSSS